jgi:hypothetical protein
MADAEVIEAMRDPHYRIGWLERTLKEALRSLQAINDSRADLEAAYRIRDIEHTLGLSSAASRRDPVEVECQPSPAVACETWRRTFTNEAAAERYLTERGFSIGRRQGGAERGILLGDFDIQKWRNLSTVDRAQLHGVLQRTGFDRDTPAVVTIFAAAPDEAHAAIRKVRPVATGVAA